MTLIRRIDPEITHGLTDLPCLTDEDRKLSLADDRAECGERVRGVPSPWNCYREAGHPGPHAVHFVTDSGCEVGYVEYEITEEDLAEARREVRAILQALKEC